MSRATDVQAEELSERTTDDLIGILSLNLMALNSEKGCMEFFAEKFPHTDPGQIAMDAEKLVKRAHRIHAVVQELLKRQRELSNANG